ncbi:uncharacterized protein RJT21DRAFT_1293 [Scheffersomyces amazonensis]|uniref:uncharacterized protein n=1 Tax=Scheffersomyces amazonensis TaxID=1078765 RepID=UPI00315C585F
MGTESTAECADWDKPNLIHSSNISDQARTISYEFITNHEDHVDLDPIKVGYNITLIINLPLTTVLAYNHTLKPSDFSEDDILLVVPDSFHLNRSTVKSGNQLVDNLLNIDKIFVLRVSLELDHISINREATEISLHFINNHHYSILQQCNSIITNHIHNYIKIELTKEINKLWNELPTPQEISRMYNDILLNDSTLEGSESESGLEKSFMYDEEAEDEDNESQTSLEDLLLLNSNDTLKNNEYPIRPTKLLTRASLSTIREDMKSDSFIENLNNLRHNEDFIDLNDIHETPYDDIDNVELLQSPIAFNFHPDPAPISDSDPILSPPISPIRKTLITQQSYPTMNTQTPKRPTNTVSKMTSMSLINNDDNTGLEYAYKDKSPTVPSYIKQDKKFRFIKVGKVQKFVDLFEEQMTKEIPQLRPPSRKPSVL